MPHREGSGLNANQLHASVLKEGWQSRLSYMFFETEWVNWLRHTEGRYSNRRQQECQSQREKSLTWKTETFFKNLWRLFKLSTRGTKQIALKLTCAVTWLLHQRYHYLRNSASVRASLKHGSSSSFADNSFFSWRVLDFSPLKNEIHPMSQSLSLAWRCERLINLDFISLSHRF